MICDAFLMTFQYPIIPTPVWAFLGVFDLFWSDGSLRDGGG
jgi:hypothetical protein